MCEISLVLKANNLNINNYVPVVVVLVIVSIGIIILPFFILLFSSYHVDLQIILPLKAYFHLTFATSAQPTGLHRPFATATTWRQVT